MEYTSRKRISVTQFLSEADLSDAQIGKIIFGSNGLGSMKGLDTVEHRGPSIIGIDTIYRSGGEIPEVFPPRLRCPRKFRRLRRIAGGQAIEYYSCFISYSHADKSFARDFTINYRGEASAAGFDEHQVLPGDNIYEMSIAGFGCGTRCCCALPHSLSSWWLITRLTPLSRRNGN